MVLTVGDGGFDTEHRKDYVTYDDLGSRGKKHSGVFPKCSRTFVEFTEFRESDKSLKHELASI